MYGIEFLACIPYVIECAISSLREFRGGLFSRLRNRGEDVVRDLKYVILVAICGFLFRLEATALPIFAVDAVDDKFVHVFLFVTLDDWECVL